MKKKLIVLVSLLVVSIMAIAMTSNAQGQGKMIDVKTTPTDPNFSGAGGAAYPLRDGETVATQFAIAADALFVGIGCPSWSDNIGELTLTLYKFNKDYDTTVAGNHMVQHTFENYSDNAFIGFEFTEADPLKAGEYLIVISDAYDEGGSGVGLWTHNAYPGQAFYEEGVYNKALSARMYVQFKGTAPETPYGTLTPVQADEGNVNKDPFPFLGAVMRFSDPDAEMYFSLVNAVSIGEAEIVDGKLQVPVLAGTDPQFYIDIQSALEPVVCEEYPIMLIRMKRSEGSPLNGEIFFNTTEFPGPTAGGSVAVDYANTTDWQDVIVDFSGNKNFKGELLSFRFDIVQSSTAEFLYEIDYILFFGTAAAAQGYDISTLPTPSPTPVPTPTPEKTATPVKTDSAATPTTKPTDEDKTEGGMNPAVIIGIVAAVVVIAVVAVVVIVKKRKA